MGGQSSQPCPPHRNGPLTVPARAGASDPASPLHPPGRPFSFPISMLPSKSVADPLPWELGLAGAAQSRLLAQHHVGFPRKCHHSWRSVESREFSAQGFQKAPSQQAAKGARAAAGRGLGVLPAEVPPTRSGQSQLNLREKGAQRLSDFTIGETEAREGTDDLLKVSKLWVLSWVTLLTPPPVCEISFRT